MGGGSSRVRHILPWSDNSPILGTLQSLSHSLTNHGKRKVIDQVHTWAILKADARLVFKGREARGRGCCDGDD
jgi:hypothetical protein